jgi:hypothetical protein
MKHLGPAGRIAMWSMTGVCLVLAVLGCASVRRPHSPLPVRHTIVRDQLVLHSDIPLPAHHRLFDDLVAQRSDVATILALPTSDEPIQVYLFESAERFSGFTQLSYPGLATRRAFFVETDTRLAVYAFWGDRVAEDLRHEVAHGYLHAVVRNIPLWLDEGLAEYFEVPRGTGGLNPPHINDLAVRLAAGGWRPNLPRLESLVAVGDMNQLDYAESWAWVHMLLETTPERRELLRAYLRQLRQTGAAEPLSLRIRGVMADPDRELAEHVFRLATPP